jgi:hypothetical protein
MSAPTLRDALRALALLAVVPDLPADTLLSYLLPDLSRSDRQNMLAELIYASDHLVTLRVAAVPRDWHSDSYRDAQSLALAHAQVRLDTALDILTAHQTRQEAGIR